MPKNVPLPFGGGTFFLWPEKIPAPSENGAGHGVARQAKKGTQPWTPPEVRPLTRCFAMDMNRMTTGTMANTDAANRYCHSIML